MLYIIKKSLGFTAVVVMICLGVQAHAQAASIPVVFEAKNQAVISAERHGVLSQLKVSVGSWVKKGDVLGTVDHDDLTADLRRKRLRRTFLQQQIANQLQLFERGMTTDDELEKLRSEEAIELANIEYLKKLVTRSSFRAPFDAVVVEKLVNRHEWVEAGKPIVKLVNPSSLRVVSSVPAGLATKWKSGMQHKVVVTDLNNTEVKLKLQMVIPDVEVQSNTMRVIWQVVKKPKKLKPGLKGMLVLPAPSE